MLTGAAGFNMVKTYSNGRMTAQWFNHLDRNYQVLNYDTVFTPFLNFDAGTGTVDRQVMPRPYELMRPYETLGLMGMGKPAGHLPSRKSSTGWKAPLTASPRWDRKRSIAGWCRRINLLGGDRDTTTVIGMNSSKRAASWSTRMVRGHQELPVTMGMACILDYQPL
jgi:hypothetical protein